MNESEYFNVWLVYFAGTLMLLLVWWRISKRWNHWVKYPCLLALATALLVPFNIESGTLHMGPAWLISLYEGVFVPEAGFARAGAVLVYAIIVALLIYPILALLWRLVRRKPKAESDEPSDGEVIAEG